jgi:hypothetical protein
MFCRMFCRIPAATSHCRPQRRNEVRSASVTVTGMLGPPAASIPRQDNSEPDRRGGRRQDPITAISLDIICVLDDISEDADEQDRD